MNPHGDSGMIGISRLYCEITISVLLCCDKSPDNFILLSLGDSSENNYHGDFTMEAPNISHMRVTKGPRCKVTW